MTKLFKESKQPEVLALANLRNFYRKRKQDSRLQVAESIISDLSLKCEPLPLCTWLDSEKAAQDAIAAEKPATAPKKSNRLPVDTMTGSTAAKAELMPVIDTDQPVIVTSAQNNTSVTPVFKQLVAIAEHLNAKLIVLPVYYNKNAFDPHEECEQEGFASEVRPYLVEDDSWLYARDCVRLAASAAVLPTAKLPINAAATLNAGELFTVVASPKQQYKTLPTLRKDRTPKAWTTASCTGFNYKRGRAGIEAETEHVFGGTLFTRDDSGAVNSTNIRQASDGSIFLYIDGEPSTIMVDPTGEISSAPPEHMANVYGKPCVKLGDLHCEMYDPMQWGLALDFVRQTKPKFVAVDDILHFSTRSHHNRNDSKHLYATRNERVENDLQQVITQLNELSQIAPVYVTESNHNSALDNWLSDTGVKIDYDSHNAKLYHLLKWLVMDTLDDGETDKNALQVALEHADLTKLPQLNDNVKFGRMDVPQIGYTYDFSQHGHKGQNGSAGSPNLIKRWNLPLVTGHTHSPCIIGSVFTTGVTARLNQGYNRGGASGWDHAHVMEHPNGECQLINTNAQV